MSKAGYKDRLEALFARIRALDEAPEAHKKRMEDSGLLSMGPHSYGNPKIVSYRGDKGRARIGAFCSLADGIEIMLGGNHRIDWISTYPFRLRFDLPGALEDGHPATKGDVEIGNDVWIARGVRIFSGVHIGNGAVLAANAIVTKDVRPYAIVGGNPAHEIRRRFSDEQIAALERIAWWNWPLERIMTEVPSLCSANLDQFITRFDPAKRPA